MKVIIMKDCSAGNDSVGEMWTETYLFSETATLRQVLDKVGDTYNIKKGMTLASNIRLNIAEEVEVSDET